MYFSKNNVGINLNKGTFNCVLYPVVMANNYYYGVYASNNSLVYNVQGVTFGKSFAIYNSNNGIYVSQGSNCFVSNGSFTRMQNGINANNGSYAEITSTKIDPVSNLASLTMGPYTGIYSDKTSNVVAFDISTTFPGNTGPTANAQFRVGNYSNFTVGSASGAALVSNYGNGNIIIDTTKTTTVDPTSLGSNNYQSNRQPLPPDDA